MSRLDLSLLICVGCLLVIGMVMVYEASVIEGFTNFNDKFYFVSRQVKWGILGLFSLVICTFLPIGLIKRCATPLLGLAVILLVLVLIPGLGISVGGARRWLNLGIVSLQPSEPAKLALIIYLSALFDKKTRFVPFIGTLIAISALVMLQPDLGTTLVIVACAFVIYFLANAPLKNLVLLIAGGLGVIVTLIMTSAYRRARLMTFLNPETDPLGSSYHIRQIILSLGSGGLVGQGFGRSLQKYQYLPEAMTDSIFAVMAEEAGFVGTLIVVALFLWIAYRGVTIASRVEDRFLKLLASGLTVLVTIQALLNLSAMAALVPLTGITLPFISYGGSSLVISLTAIGLLLNISRFKQ